MTSPLLTFTLRIASALLVALTLGQAHAGALEVTVSFSILGDFVRQVGGERVRVRTLVGPDEDSHAFQPRPSDVRNIAASHLVVANGLGFDDWIVRLARSSGFNGPVVIASRGARTLEMGNSDPHHHDDPAHSGGGIDPHAWQDATNARRYVANIATALAAADPDGAAHYRARAEQYSAQLQALDSEIRDTLAAIPPEKRKVVSSHDAFGYFARAYRIRFLAPVGVSNSAEPTAQGVARLIRQLKAENVPAVFIENIADPRLIERIRNESGARVGGTLYSDALSASTGPAPDYLAMMRYNLHQLHAALVPASKP